MAKIRRARVPGETSFRTKSVEGFTGKRVSADRETKSSVRRIFARDPNKDQSGLTDFTNHPDIPNPNAAPSPTIINGTAIVRTSVARTFGVVNRSLNRRIRRR